MKEAHRKNYTGLRRVPQRAPSAPPRFSAFAPRPANYQAWVALPGDEDGDLARRLRKGTGADTTASGATRAARSDDHLSERYRRVFTYLGCFQIRCHLGFTFFPILLTNVAVLYPLGRDLPSGLPRLAGGCILWLRLPVNPLRR